MGSPEFCYRSILKDFILYNSDSQKQYKFLEEDILSDKTTKELEEIALKYYKENKDYSLFLMGTCTQAFICKWNECNDIINACAGAISDIQDLFHINEEKENNSTILIWHDCKTDPPKKEGFYLLSYFISGEKHWDKAYYYTLKSKWEDEDHYGLYDGYYIPCEWAEVIF